MSRYSTDLSMVVFWICLCFTNLLLAYVFNQISATFKTIWFKIHVTGRVLIIATPIMTIMPLIMIVGMFIQILLEMLEVFKD